VAYVMTAYNATVHSATGFTPNRLVFGSEMRYPNELMYVGVEDKILDDRSYSNFVEDQRKNFRDGFDGARESLGLNPDWSKKRYDMRVRPNVYAVGDDVTLTQMTHVTHVATPVAHTRITDITRTRITHITHMRITHVTSHVVHTRTIHVAQMQMTQIISTRLTRLDILEIYHIPQTYHIPQRYQIA